MKYAIIFICLFVFGCTPNLYLNEQREIYKYQTWEQQFKDRAFCLCVQQGFSKPMQDSLFKQDKSFYDPLAIAVFDEAINKLLVAERIKISNDSAKSMTHVVPYDIADIINGKRVMPHCIELYKSKRLAVLAKQQKKYWKSIKDIQEEILKKIPTF